MPADAQFELCVEAERMLDLAWTTSDQSQADELMKRAHDLLLPLVAVGNPHAQFLHACATLGLDVTDEAEFEKEHHRLIEAAAQSGHAKAQFRLGQDYDNGGDLGHNPDESARWFRLSAEQGYPHAKWVYGLNLFESAGIAPDAELGLNFIRKAADGKFEGAIEFVAAAYAEGRHGFPRDEVRARQWRAKLKDADVIGY